MVLFSTRSPQHRSLPAGTTGWGLILLTVYWLGMTVASHLPFRFFHHWNHADKWAHLSGYTGLSLLALATLVPSISSGRAARGLPGRARDGLRRSGSDKRRRAAGSVRYLAVIGGLLLLAGLDELTQRWIPHRTCDFQDWLADSGGILLGLLTLLSWRYIVPMGWSKDRGAMTDSVRPALSRPVRPSERTDRPSTPVAPSASDHRGRLPSGSQSPRS